MGGGRKGAQQGLRTVLGSIFVLAVLLGFFTALNDLRSGQREAGRQQLETALRRAALSCYANEGVYPPDLDWLQAHSGIQVDESRYLVFYEVFADNLMPNITVLEKGS